MGRMLGFDIDKSQRGGCKETQQGQGLTILMMLLRGLYADDVERVTRDIQEGY